MPRPKNLIPTHRVVAYIRQDLYAKALLDLYSDVQGRVPMGKWSELFNALLEQALAQPKKEATNGSNQP